MLRQQEKLYVTNMGAAPTRAAATGAATRECDPRVQHPEKEQPLKQQPWEQKPRFENEQPLKQQPWEQQPRYSISSSSGNISPKNSYPEEPNNCLQSLLVTIHLKQNVSVTTSYRHSVSAGLSCVNSLISYSLHRYSYFSKQE